MTEPPATPVQTCVIVPQSHHEGHYVNWCKTHHQPASLCMNNVFPVPEGGDEVELPSQGITREKAFELVANAERPILEILMNSPTIATNRWKLQAAREIAKLNTRTSQPASSPSDALKQLMKLRDEVSAYFVWRTDPDKKGKHHEIPDDAIRAVNELCQRIAAALSSTGERGEPIDMILFCPRCGEQHIDSEESEVDFKHKMQAWALVAEPQDNHPTRWTNSPHRSHLCHNCGAVFRFADVPTNGVAQISTKGSRDTWTPCAYIPLTPDLQQRARAAARNIDDSYDRLGRLGTSAQYREEVAAIIERAFTTDVEQGEQQ